jgi:hypothetical protein
MKALAAAFIMMLVGCCSVQAQNFTWAKNAATNNNYYYYNYGIAVDRFGNLATSGYFHDSIQIGTTTLRSAGTYATFIARYDADGIPIWAKGILPTNTSSYCWGYGVAFDSSGNVYNTGVFFGTISFGSVTLTQNGSSYGQYLAKSDSNGNLLWAKQLGNSAGFYSYYFGNIATDSLSNCYVLSSFTGAITLDTLTYNSPAGKYSNLLTKFDAKGNVVRVRQLSTTDSLYIYAISARKNGEILTTGLLAANRVNLDNASLIPIGGNDAFVLKFNHNGVAQWGDVFGGPHVDYGSALSSDAAGNIYVSGSFLDTMQIGPFSVFAKSSTANSTFLTKLAPDGSVDWAQKIGDSLPSSFWNNSLAVDAGGNIYYGLTYYGTQQIGKFTILNRGSSDFAVIKFTTNGTPLWVASAGGTSYDYLTGIGIDGYGNTYLTGFYIAQCQFGKIGLTGGASYYSGFIAKIKEPIILTRSPGKSNYCAGDTIAVQYEGTGLYQFGNQFIAQLSDSAGVFDSLRTVSIGKIGSTSDTGVIQCRIPLTARFGNAYKIRIVSTSPSLEGLQIGPYFTIHPLPNVKIVARKPATFCAGGNTDLAVTIPGYGGRAFYRWSSSSDASLSDTSQLLEPAVPGTYYVAVADTNGCQAVDSIVVKVLSLPKATMSAVGPKSFCKGGSVMLTANGGRTYLWSTGATTASIVTDSSGVYTVLVTNDSGCSNESAPVLVTVWPLPTVPIITRQENKLLSSAASNNQWYYYGKPLDGDTNRTLDVHVNGDFSVVVHNGFGCSASSSVVRITSGVKALTAVPLQLSILPNPVRTLARVSFDLQVRTRINIQVLDILGVLVKSLEDGVEEAGHHERTFDFDHAAAEGTYFVRAVIGAQVITQKVLLVH